MVFDCVGSLGNGSAVAVDLLRLYLLACSPEWRIRSGIYLRQFSTLLGMTPALRLLVGFISLGRHDLQ